MEPHALASAKGGGWLLKGRKIINSMEKKKRKKDRDVAFNLSYSSFRFECRADFLKLPSSRR